MSKGTDLKCFKCAHKLQEHAYILTYAYECQCALKRQIMTKYTETHTNTHEHIERAFEIRNGLLSAHT